LLRANQQPDFETHCLCDDDCQWDSGYHLITYR
jgi:hypothetical protein